MPARNPFQVRVQIDTEGDLKILSAHYRWIPLKSSRWATLVVSAYSHLKLLSTLHVPQQRMNDETEGQQLSVGGGSGMKSDGTSAW